MKSSNEVKMITPNALILLMIMILGLTAGIYRLVAGLGAATNLNDDFPWGFWIGFDLLAGVALTAGGFVIAGAVYLFNMKKYKPIARSAVLTAFIGYLMAILALIFDLGHPARIWHPVVMWQTESVMFEVAFCVMTYSTVLALEFSPMLFERLNMPNAKTYIDKILIPLVLLGTVLSVLHQSSLGGLFLIVQNKMSPLWYNSFLPYLFLVSSVMLGLSMLSFESILSSKAFKHPVNMDILSGLARGSTVAIGIYLVLKLILLAKGPGIGAAFAGTMEANMYLLEIIVGSIIPLVLLFGKNITLSISGILFVNILVIIGVIINRLNITIFSMYRFNSSHGANYFPSFIEIMITLGLIALGIFLYKLGAKNLQLFQEV